MSAFLKITNRNHTWTLVLAAVAVLLALAPQIAAIGRADNSTVCRPDVVAASEPRQLQEVDPAQQMLTDYLARRFSIAAGPTAIVVGTAYRAAEQSGLDPLLVLAVISIESRFNPIAESVMGAKGLMQIIPKYHRARLLEHGGEEAVLDPESNILVGTKILQEYVYRTGTLEAGLQTYNGAARDGSAQYAQRVFAERERLEQVLRAARASRTLALNSKSTL
ncbi:MAG TPA: transglycosylase SLT domain-containing protein [Burkholderiales bacterium]|nr:transglycosylase SLT domain-containing protein [Burkholderiales bacterium]